MMVLQVLGVEALVRLMNADEEQRPDLSWLLFGPTDPALVATEDAPASPRLLAAE